MIVKQATSLEEAVELLSKYEKPKLIAGGTDIIIEINEKIISPKALIDISKVEELRKIEDKGDYIEIGAAVTFTDVVESKLIEKNLKGLKKACREVGSPQIRNRGTLGGNIANGSPAADSVPPLMALDSSVVLISKRGKREVKLEEYFSHNELLGIKEDEILAYIRFKKPLGTLTFAKLGLRKALAISRLSLSALVELDSDNKVKLIRLASGSIGKFPMREYEVEEFLQGKVLDKNTFKLALSILQDCMDRRLAGRPTLPYKKRAVEAVFNEALMEVVL